MSAKTEEAMRVSRRPGACVGKRSTPCKLRNVDITSYLNQMRLAGRSASTISKYKADIIRFQDFLEDEFIYPETFGRWRQSMIDEGYSARTINASIVAVNGLLQYLGCHDWQLFDWMELEKVDDQGLTREEYHLLLKEAKRQGDVQLYLLVKTLGCTELTPGDLPLLTKEAVAVGEVRGWSKKAERQIMLPASLKEDLLEFARYRCIRNGPIFLGSRGAALDRTVISRMIMELGASARLKPGRANPRNLHRMYLHTMAELQATANAWVTNSYWNTLEEEETQIGWSAGA